MTTFVSSAFTGRIDALTFDNSGNLYAANADYSLVHKIDASGNDSVFSGSYLGFQDAYALQAAFRNPHGMCMSQDGTTIYVADTNNHLIRAMNIVSGDTRTIAGGGGYSQGFTASGYSDGAGLNARFSYPYDILADTSGNLFVADSANNRIRQIQLSTGVVTTVAQLSYGPICLRFSANNTILFTGNNCITELVPNT